LFSPQFFNLFGFYFLEIKTMNTLYFFCLLLFFFSEIFAKQVWVDTVNGLDLPSCGNEINYPCRSISFAITQTSRYDELILVPILNPQNIEDTPFFGPKNVNITIIDKDLTIRSSSNTSAWIDCQGLGWAFSIYGTNTTIINVQFSGCIGTSGGSILVNTGSLSIVSCLFEGGMASNLGGSIYMTAFSNELIVSDSTFMNNTANQGGAIYGSGSVILSNTNFLENNSTSRGGAVVSGKGSSFTECIFSQNQASSGGALYATFDIQITSTTFQNNFASMDGGGVYLLSGSMTGTGNNFASNSANGRGGGLFAGPGGYVSFVNSIFTNNNAMQGGALYSDGSEIYLNSVSDATNNASDGGSFYILNGLLQVTQGYVSGNIAQNRGGAIYCSLSSMSFQQQPSLLNNQAPNSPIIYCDRCLINGPTDLEQLCPSSLQGQASNSNLVIILIVLIILLIVFTILLIIGTICHVRHKKAVAKALLNG